MFISFNNFSGILSVYKKQINKIFYKKVNINVIQTFNDHKLSIKYKEELTQVGIWREEIMLWECKWFSQNIVNQKSSI